MISLYESILSSTKSGKTSTVLPDLIDAISSISDLKDVSVTFSDRFIQLPKSFTKNEIYSRDSAITFSFKGSTRTTVWKYIKHFFTKHNYKEKYTHLTSISGIKNNQILVSQEDTFSSNQEEYILVYIFKIENLYIVINLKEIGICNYLLTVCVCNDDYDIDTKIMKQIKDEIKK
jgi:hypothetical protein